MTERRGTLCVGGPFGSLSRIHVKDATQETVAPPRRYGVVVSVILHVDVQDIVSEGTLVKQSFCERSFCDT